MCVVRVSSWLCVLGCRQSRRERESGSLRCLPGGGGRGAREQASEREIFDRAAAAASHHHHHHPGVCFRRRAPRARARGAAHAANFLYKRRAGGMPHA